MSLELALTMSSTNPVTWVGGAKRTKAKSKSTLDWENYTQKHELAEIIRVRKSWQQAMIASRALGLHEIT